MRSAPDATDAAAVRIAGNAIYRGETPLTPAYLAIDSFDVSVERREVIFSAKRETSFDVGLVSLDGSQVNWVPEDPADEVAPQWAPRGHKASYIVRNRGGDLIRTVHIPTAFQLVVDFPFGVVRDLAWDDGGERFALAWESPDASPRIEVLRYGGEERRIAVAPSVQLDVEVTPFAGGLMLRPASLVYNERLPLVVWRTGGRLNEWSDARGALLRSGRIALLVVDAAAGDAVAQAIDRTSWIDRDRLFVVDPEGTAELAGAVVVRGDAGVRAGFYRRDARGIAVHPGSVESTAVGYIQEQLKVPHGG
ncbi:MAG TPA: hypothetical protein VM779_00800 [Thermoanaerobaculia bacterium]|nr:hypothetical protein [Thermoanaerobaculia bacterium]